MVELITESELIDRRFSVPYQYAGKSVKVVIHPRQGILECFDLMTGKRITKHHYGTTTKGDVVAKEHIDILSCVNRIDTRSMK